MTKQTLDESERRGLAIRSAWRNEQKWQIENCEATACANRKIAALNDKQAALYRQQIRENDRLWAPWLRKHGVTP